MKKLIVISLAVLSVLSLVAFSKRRRGVKNRKRAPGFTAKDQDGKTVSLSDYRGKKVLLYFYPKDDTPGCTAEACSLRDNFHSLTKEGYTILGVSTDDEVSHKNFKEKYHLPFTLIADVDKSIVNKYGAWIEKEKDGKKYWGTARKTFLIDENGMMEGEIKDVDTQQHAQQVLAYKPAL